MIVTGVDAATGIVLIVNVAVVLAAATVTLAGIVAAAGREVESVTTAPPAGALPVSVTVPVNAIPPTTLAGLNPNERTLGGCTVSTAGWLTPPEEAVIVTWVDAVTEVVVRLTVAVV